MTSKRRTALHLVAHEFGPGHATAGNQATFTAIGAPGVGSWSMLGSGTTDQFIGWCGPAPEITNPFIRTPERWRPGTFTDIEVYFTTDGADTDDITLLIGIQSIERNETISSAVGETMTISPTGSGADGGLGGELGRHKLTLSSPVTIARGDWAGVIIGRDVSADTNDDLFHFLGCTLFRS